MKLKQIALHGFVTLSLASVGICAAASLPMVKLTQMPGTVTEGDPVRFDFKLSRPAPPTGLNVRLTLYRDSDPLPGNVECFVEGRQGITVAKVTQRNGRTVYHLRVNIAAGMTDAVLRSAVLADGKTERPEGGGFGLAAGSGYSIDAEHAEHIFTRSIEHGAGSLT